MSSPEGSWMAHYLEGHGGLDQQVKKIIWDRLHRAHMTADDPAGMIIAENAVRQAALERHEKSLDTFLKRLDQATTATAIQTIGIIASARDADRKEIVQATAAEVRRALQSSIPSLEKEVLRGAVLRLIRCIILIALFGGGIGYVVGRHDTHGLTVASSELAKRPDAKTWISLQQNNPNLDTTIARECGPGHEGYAADKAGIEFCFIPLRLETSAPLRTGLIGTVLNDLESMRARLPVWALILSGMALGVICVPLIKRLKNWIIA